MDESPERKWNRVQKKLHNTILTSFPNPNREGCPGPAALSDLARRAADLGTLEDEDGWEHVTHCSPCYREYLEARDLLRKSRGFDGNEAAKK
jgi:hypothetical protein